MREVQVRFGDAVRAERARRGYSQEKLGELAGLDRTYVSGIERGLRNPSLSNIQRLADALDVSLVRLFKQVEGRK